MKPKRRKLLLIRLFLIAILLASNSFAWFIFSTKVSNSVQAHVRAWNVAFEIGDEETENYVLVEIEEAYPGMTTYNKRVRAANHGEADADLTYEVTSATIFGTTYTAEGAVTSAQLERMLAENYPFSIQVTLSSPVIRVGDTTQYYNFSMSWPYESGDDEEDTYWGTLAYDYHDAHPTEPSITLEVKIQAIQRSAS